MSSTESELIQKKRAKVSVIIPAYNEEKTIADVLKILVSVRQNGLIDEIIVVSDGSNDNTARVAKISGVDNVLDLKKNIGKTKAVIEGVKYTSGEILLFLDADLKGLVPKHIESLLIPIFNEKADMTIGYLFDDPVQKILPHLSGQRALRRELISQINNKKMELNKYGLEILLNRTAKKKGLKILFLPLSGISHLSKNQKYGFKKALSRKTLSSLNILYLYRWQILGTVFITITFIFWNIFLKNENVKGIILNEIEEPQRKDSILVIVSHPDDEILGTEGYIYRALRNGSSLKIVFITNGDGNRFSTAISEKGLSSEDFIKMGKIRMRESLKAASILGLKTEQLIFLGFPDRNIKALLTENWNIPKVSPYTKRNKNEYKGTYRENIEYTGENLLFLLSEIIRDFNPSIIITHNPHDRHPDHSTTYHFVKKAIKEAKVNPIVYTFLIHWDIGKYPKPFAKNLYPPGQLQSECAWYIFSLSKDDKKRKHELINQFNTQLESPYLYFLSREFLRENELFCLDQ
jgi:LmbE family N-acetylglucosaminyl deacetylase